MPKTSLGFRYSDTQSFMLHESEQLGRYRIFPKGRRLGATQGAAHAFVEWMLEGRVLLWGDTIHANIDRYYERYFVPVLQRLPSYAWSWNQQKKLLRVGSGYADFRSADNPQNWEGFGYDVVFLNEAGIILHDEYLYYNAVLPMMIDRPNSSLIAAGTPKLMQGKGRLFAELWRRVERGEPGYVGKRYTTYDNPWLKRADIDTLITEIAPAERAQEIYGEFVEAGGQRIKREWLKRARPPEGLECVMAVDLAISTKAGADYTAAVVMARDNAGNIYILDAQRIRGAFHDVIAFIKRMAEKWQPSVIGIEQVQYQAAVVQELQRSTSLPIQPLTPDKDKLTRFLPLELRYASGLVFHAPSLEAFYEDELLAFPAGAHDDAVDAAAYAYGLLGRSRWGVL